MYLLLFLNYDINFVTTVIHFIIFIVSTQSVGPKSRTGKEGE